MTNTENIKNKIKKLLALANDGVADSESYSALQKAQALMVEYKLSINDVSDTKDIAKEKIIKKKTVFSYGTRSSDHYINDLAEIIANNFCCVSYLSTSSKRTFCVCFMGNESDVSICEEAMHVANTSILRGYNQVYHDLRKSYDCSYIPASVFNPAKVGYVRGYLAGLKEVFDSQKKKNQEWGLILSAPKEAKDYINSLNTFNTGSDGAIVITYYNDGYNDGKQFNINKKINPDMSPKLSRS